MSRPTFGRKHSAPVDGAKIAIRKLVPLLGLLVLLVVDPQVPFSVFVIPCIRMNSFSSSALGWCSLQASLSSNVTCFALDEVFRLCESRFAQFHCHVPTFFVLPLSHKLSPGSGEQTLPARAEDQNFFFRFVHQGSYGK